MSVFKRLCLLVFGLAGIFAIAALTLPWLGPWTEQATSMLAVRWYYISLEVCICITALGVLIALLRALFTPRRVRAVVVSKSGADQITITTSAISSQAAHIVETSGSFTADKVWVTARKHAVDVTVRVRPDYAMNIVEEGAALHERLADGLAELAGDTIRSIELEFVEADSLDAAPSYAEYDVASVPVSHQVPGAPASGAALPEAPAEAPAASSEITVPMGHGPAPAAEQHVTDFSAVSLFGPAPDVEPAIDPGIAPYPEPGADDDGSLGEGEEPHEWSSAAEPDTFEEV